VFNVNSTADILNPTAGTITLRSAIQSANATPGGNTINLTVAGTYKITLAGTPGETDNAAGEFAILPAGGNLTIVNTSGGVVVVDGNNLNRVFDINPANTDNPGTQISVTMVGFTIQNGFAQPGDGAGGSGGGIRDQGNADLTLTNMIITNNTASADGGGVSMENAPASTPWALILNNTIVSNNHAGDAGGGIESDGDGVDIINGGTLSGNTSVNQGAAVWLDATPDGVASVTINTPGTGYTTAPTVTFSAPQNAGGITATGTATITGGVVTAVTITNPGTGYTAAPTVTFSAPTSGTTATGTANLGVNTSSDLTMTGVVVSGNTAQNGPTGAIGNAGNGAVTINNCTIENNFSGSTGGGFGDENNLGTLTVSNSLFLNNSAVGNGGAIQEGGPSTTITSSVIQGNSTNASGGGIFANGTTLTIRNSTISNNTSAFTSANPPHFGGGGIEVQTTGTGSNASTITNTTIAGNRVLNNAGLNNGGGIDASANFTGTLTLLNDTITGNFADSGGGVFWAGAGSSAVNVENTVIATNKANVAGPDANNPAGTFTDNGGNLIGISGTGSGNTGFAAGTTQTGTVATPLDPQLGPLQNNGSPTVGAPSAPGTLLTESPLLGSPLLAKGTTTGAPTTDERGYQRPASGSGNPAVGALELLTAQERFVQAVFVDELGRPGSTAELDAWVGAMKGPLGQAGVVSSILHTQEARDRLVKGWYQTYLGRAASGGEEQGFVNLLLAGATEEQTLSVLLGNQEFTNRAQTLVSSGTSQQRVVTALYKLLLNRTPTPAELSAQIPSLGALGQQGFALALLQSQEFRGITVAGYYVNALHRAADQAGVNGWVFSGVDLGSVRSDFEASAEFFANG
jgi:hypothetical protein